MNASRHLVRALCCVLALFLVGSAHIGEAGAQEADNSSEWTLDDVLLAESAGQYRISPDGEWVVWVKTTVSEDKGGRVSNLYLSSITEDLEIQLTRGNQSHSAPRWSPDGKHISFMSTRPLPKKEGDASSSQLWLINPSGGEPWPLTSFERGIRSYEWKDDDMIIFTAQEDADLYEREIEKGKDTSRVVDDEEHVAPVRLFSFSVKTKQVTRLTDNGDRLGGFALSPDGNLAVAVHNRSLSYVYDQRVPPVTYLWNLETGEGREIFDGSRIIPGGAHGSKARTRLTLQTDY